MAVTSVGATDGALAAGVTPVSGSSAHTNGFLGGLKALITMDANKMPAKVMLSGERSAAGAVRADMGLQPVRVVSGHVGLEIVGPRKA